MLRCQRVCRISALLVAVILGGCEAQLHRAEPRVVHVNPTPQPPPPGPGRFYVKAGANSLNADLFEMRFSPLDFQRLTTNARVTTISGCDRALIVSAAQKEVGYADRLQQFKDGKLEPVDGLGRPPASDPHVAPDCRILYYEQVEENGALLGEVRLWDPATGSMTPLERGDPEALAGATWGPDGAIAVLRRETAGAMVTIIGPDGSRRVLDPKMADAGNTQWGQSGWLAIGEYVAGNTEQTGTVFVNPATGERQALAGWVPLVWCPDGTRFLVSKAGEREKLGVVEITDLTAVREVGTSTVGPVWDAVWLAA